MCYNRKSVMGHGTVYEVCRNQSLSERGYSRFKLCTMRLGSIVSLDPEAKLKLLAFIVFVIPVGVLALLNPGPWEKSYERWLDKHEHLRYSLLMPVTEGWVMLLTALQYIGIER